MAILNAKGFLKGGIGELVFRNFRGKQVIQAKPKKSTPTAGSVGSSLEFGLCSASAKVMREAFGAVVSGYDGAMINRFNGVVRNSLTACRNKVCGERDLHDADLSFYHGFQFNQNSPVDKVLEIKPKAEMDEDCRLRLTIPSFSADEILGIKSYYFKIRFLAISFDFKAECYRYHRVKDIRLKGAERFEGEELELDLEVPKGRMLLLSMSLHAYSVNNLGEEVNLNTTQWNPAEIIGGWHIPPDEEVEQIRAEGRESTLVTPLDFPSSHDRGSFLKRFRELREDTQESHQASSRHKEEPIPKWPKDDLPGGDIGFRKG